MSTIPGLRGGYAGGPLTEDEHVLVRRLLSDLTNFPIEFFVSIKQYLETSDIKLPRTAIIGLDGAKGKTNLPPGLIVIYGGSIFGPDVLPCNGAAVSRTDYAALFEAIEDTWGPGDGSATFNVPDLQDRSLYSAGSVLTLGATDALALGARGGPYHHHDPPLDPPGLLYLYTDGTTYDLQPGSVTFYLTSNTDVMTGGDQALGVGGPTPSFAVINFCITTGI